MDENVTLAVIAAAGAAWGFTPTDPDAVWIDTLDAEVAS
jgi:hypothetical protein